MDWNAVDVERLAEMRCPSCHGTLGGGLMRQVEWSARRCVVVVSCPGRGSESMAILEDHPLEYANFEGIIPEGEYGGGTVMIWDEGFWAPMEEIDPARGLDKGELRFLLDGKKLKGSWTLVSTGDRKWLLMKRRDEYAS